MNSPYLLLSPTDFNPHFRAEAPKRAQALCTSALFQPSLPRRKRRSACVTAAGTGLFQSSLPRRKRRQQVGHDALHDRISILASAQKASLPACGHYRYNMLFQSSLPRRKRPLRRGDAGSHCDFNPRFRAEAPSLYPHIHQNILFTSSKFLHIPLFSLCPFPRYPRSPRCEPSRPALFSPVSHRSAAFRLCVPQRRLRRKKLLTRRQSACISGRE